MQPRLATSPRVVIVTPAPRGSRSGNRKTALRWAGLLRQLGASVRVMDRWRDEACDLLLAVHAVKSADSVLAAAAGRPDLRIAILLAGTDVYPEFRPDATTLRSLLRADAVITLQPHAETVLPPALATKSRTILQSAIATTCPPKAATFTACVLAHLRAVKAPLLPFEAMAHVAKSIPIDLVVAGRALTPELAAAARATAARDHRCRWLGELSRREAQLLLGSSHLCIVPSSAEGGANVISEAIAVGTPILATAIPGNTGLLGADWPGLFDSGNAVQLGELLTRAALDSGYYQRLVAATAALQDLVSPARESSALLELLMDLGLGGDRAG